MRYGFEPEDEEIVPTYRELFPEEDARLYARPEMFRPPTRAVAYASVVVSLLLAAVLVYAHLRGERPAAPALRSHEQRGGPAAPADSVPRRPAHQRPLAPAF